MRRPLVSFSPGAVATIALWKSAPMQWSYNTSDSRVGSDSEPHTNHGSDSFLDAVSDPDAWRFLCNSRASSWDMREDEQTNIQIYRNDAQSKDIIVNIIQLAYRSPHSKLDHCRHSIFSKITTVGPLCRMMLINVMLTYTLDFFVYMRNKCNCKRCQRRLKTRPRNVR